MNYIENSVGTYLHSKYLLYPLSNFRVHLIELFLPGLYVGITEQEGVDSLQRHGTGPAALILAGPLLMVLYVRKKQAASLLLAWFFMAARLLLTGYKKAQNSWLPTH